MSIINTSTNDEFQKNVIKNDKIVLVDFWAQWCAPCRMMAPILENIAKKMDNDVAIVKVDVEASAENGALAQKYEVQGIPNMQVFKDGKVVDQLIGMRPQATLEDELTKHIG